uniref:Tumor necrosis factor ligand superfamily member 10 n=1 Tax=Pundamilia nyererei TaxID=303518 RepID=A0A3B4FDN1_9CICH
MAMSISVQSLGLILLAAVLLQTIAVAVSFMYFNKVLNTMQESFSRSSMSCLVNPNLNFLDAAEKKSDPCWQVTQQVHYYLKKVFIDLWVSLPKVGAHVTGVVSSAEPPNSETVPGLQSSKGYLGERIRVWEGQRGLSFLQNIELRGGELLVPRAGLYYIYAQTYFKLPSMGEMDGETREEQGAQLVQYIYKKMSSYTAPILLMKSIRSVCWPRGQEPGLFSLHQAGTAFLQPADRLFITVSNASVIEMDGRANYFGAFLVS